MARQTFAVTGMTCGHCAAAVNEAVGAVEGVSDVRVDVQRGMVSFAAEAPAPVEAVSLAVSEAGYALAGPE